MSFLGSFMAVAVAAVAITCAVAATNPVSFAGKAFATSGSGGSTCTLTPSPELLAALRDIGNERVRVTVFTGRQRSGVSTLAQEVSNSPKCQFVPHTSHHADGSSVTVCLASATSTTAVGSEPHLWIDVHTADGKAADRCPLALTAAAALVADALVVTDFETVTAETLAAAEHTARFAEVLAAAVASRHSVDDTLQRIDLPSSGGSNTLQPPSRLLVLAANKIDSDCTDDTAMEQFRAGLGARVVEDMKRAKGVVTAAGDGGVDADDGPEFDDLLGLAQTFDAARVATVRHRKVCGDPALRSDAADLRSIIFAGSLPLRTGAQLADTLEAAASEASNPGTVPARPRPWLLWVREMATAAVNDAQQFFRLALEEGTVPRNSGRVAAGDEQGAADLGSPTASDKDAFLSKALVHARPGTRAPKTVPTLNDFDRLASAAASAATDMVRRRLFRAAPKKKLEELARVMASDAKRFKATLAATTEKMFRDFADECAAYAAASRDIATLPVEDSAIDAWAKKYGDFCDARFTRHLGSHRTQLEGSYDTASKALRTGINKHALATKSQSGDRLLAILKEETSVIVDGVTQRRLRVQDALTRAAVEQTCTAAKADGVKELTDAAKRRVGAWAAKATVFPEAARRLDVKLNKACSDARAANAVRVKTRMQRVVDDVAGPFERLLHAIVLPVDREQIQATASKEEERAIAGFHDALAGFAADETSGALAELRARIDRVRTRILDSNTELWQQKLVSLRQCASGIVQDAIFDAWYLSPVHYSPWWVRWCLRSAVHHCAQHNTATASIPGGVPASTLQDVIDFWLTRDVRFGRLLDRASWNQKLVGIVVFAAVFALFRAATTSQADAAARDAARAPAPQGHYPGPGRRTGYYS